jgi:hypothetical protein
MAWLRSIEHNTRQLAQLSKADRHCLLAAIALLPLVALSLRCRGLLATQRSVAQTGRARRLHGDRALEQARRIARMTDIAARHTAPWASCLTRSVTLVAMLHRSGIAGELRIGARRLEGRFEAHAWVEVAGTVVNDAVDVTNRYRTLQGATSQPRLH